MYPPIKYDDNIRNLIVRFKKQQEVLQDQIVLEKPKNEIKFIGGCDSSLFEDKIFSVFVIFKYPSLEEIEVQTGFSKLEFPYIPGYLSFRELPNLVKTYKQIKNQPDLIMVDGSGLIHPRKLGIATHLGIVLGVPTIGIAKNKLFGKYKMPAETKGSYTFVTNKEEKLGFALRSKDKVKPIFVSPGNLCDFDTALEITLATLRKHKLPEPTRIADLYSKKLKNL